MADLINKNNISFRCSYGGECMAEIEDCKVCVHYVCDYEDVQNVDVIAEQEIRAKAIDEFAERLKEEYKPIEDSDTDICRMVFKRFDEIAEQMKGGAV